MTAADRQELRELVDTYALGVDRGDGAAVSLLFTPDADFVLWLDPAVDTPTVEHHGRDEIRAAIDQVDRYRATHHAVTATRSVVDGESATGVTNCEAHHVEGSPPNARDHVLHIRYDDTFARTDEGWRFRRRELRVRWIATLPVDS